MDYYCYLLSSDNMTYIGITNNISKRIDQHNKLISNGAKSTRRFNNWKYERIVGFFDSKGEAQKFEYIWKHYKSKTGKTYKTKAGIINKLIRLNTLLKSDQWMHLVVIY